MLYTSKSFTTNYQLEEADVVFLGIPFDSTAYSEGNQRYGPLTIRQALKHRISYQQDLDKNPLKNLKIHDVGDLEVVPGNYIKTEERIKETINSIKEVNKDAFIASIGGEHTVSLGLVKSIQPKTVVQLDAHKDMDEELNTNNYTHNTWVKRLDNKIKLIQAGVREYSEEESEYEVNGLEHLDNAPEPIYLSIDMDVIDPVFAPDVGYPEPNGQTPKELDEMLERIFEKKIVGMDVCEVASKEINNRTSYLAGWIILRTLSRLNP